MRFSRSKRHHHQRNIISFASKFKLYKSLVISMYLSDVETWTLLADSENKNPGFRNQVPEKISPHLLLGAQVQLPTGCRARSTAFWAHRNLFWQLSRGGKWRMVQACHVPRQTPKPSFTEPWSMVDAVAGRENAGRTTSNVKEWNCSDHCQWPPAERTGSRSLLTPPHDPISQGIEFT